MKKEDKYKVEREALLQELLNIIDLQDSSFNSLVKTTTLAELDDKKEQIDVLLPKLRKYFAVKNTALLYPDDTKRLHLAIVRAVLKQRYKMVGNMVRNGESMTMRYHFYPLE